MTKGKRDKRRPKSAAGVKVFDVFLQAGRVLYTARLVNTAVWAKVSFEFPRDDEPPMGSKHFIVPSQFLFVLALELHLKCLLSLRGRPIERVHSLKQSLFNKLPLADRRAARSYFMAKAANDPDIQSLKKTFGFELTLDLVLQSCEHVFQTFRYWHEYKAGELFPRVRGRARTRGTLGINFALAAIRQVIFDNPEAKDWPQKFSALAEEGEPEPIRKGMRQLVVTSQGETFEFTPKSGGQPEMFWP
jgi:hypothetical protein